MQTIGVYEAKTHLARLLERVSRGESVTITKHGRPVAKLVPTRTAPSPQDVAAELRALRRGVALGGPLRELLEEGRA